MHIKTVSTPRLAQQAPIDPAKLAEANELLSEIRAGASYAMQRLEMLNARDREAGEDESEEAKEMQSNLAALRSAVTNAEMHGVVDALDILHVAKTSCLEGDKSIYLGEQNEKRAKKADKAREKRKRKKANQKAAQSSAPEGTDDAAGASDVEVEEPSVDLTVTATSTALVELEPVAEMPSLADSTSSLDDHPAQPVTPGSVTASVMSEDAESSSTPASSSHGDTPVVGTVEEETPEPEANKPMPSQVVALVEEEIPTPSSSGKASPARRNSFEAAERAADWADEVAAAERARADSPARSDGDWQEVIKAPRGKRERQPSQLAQDDGQGLRSAFQPQPRASWGKGNYVSAPSDQVR